MSIDHKNQYDRISPKIMHATVEHIKRYPVEVPFRDVPKRHMDRELPHWRYFEVVEVELNDGSVGYGETMLFYTWGETTDADVERVEGANAAELMWDDSLGAGLQIALFDAVGRSLGAPVHALLGDQVHERTPISWWCIDMPPEDWVAEAKRAVERGYTNLKVKGRPWFDIQEQLEVLDEALPEWFSVDVDFNGTLLDADRGGPLLEQIETFEQVSHIEGPIPQSDVDGNRHLTESLDVPVALHYGDPDPMVMLWERMCDGFVATGGASHLRDVAAVTETAGRPFWLQLVGTGITAAFSLHCGGVFERANWPAISCHQLYMDDLLVNPIDVENGSAPVPDAPGLGHEIDVDTVERFRCEKPTKRPNPPRLVESNWTDGPTMYFSEGKLNFMIEYAMEEAIPYYESGVETRLVRDDGSERWRTLYEETADGPVVRHEPAF